MTADLGDPALRRRAVAAARGYAAFDCLITGGQLADLVTDEFRAADIGLVGALIASVHARGSRADAARVIDARGGNVAPGLIDTHMHIESSMVTPATYASAVLPRGVTTVVWDPHEFGNFRGLDGVRWARDAVVEFGGAELAEMLSWPGVAGVA